MMNHNDKKLPDFEKAEAFVLESLKNDLPSDLVYHGYHHTIDVMQAAVEIGEYEKLSPEETGLLRVAVALHDSGFIQSHKNHEERGCEFARELLPGFGFSNRQIEIVCGMIMATRVPQRPNSKLEYIICDADLDYLGRDDVEAVSRTLHDELNIRLKPLDEKSWDDIQIAFLKSHHYYTAWSIANRKEKKQQYLDGLINKWE